MRYVSLGAVALVAPVMLAAQAAKDTAVRVTFGGFVDGYYAYDFNRPRTLDRQFTTQAARHDEFNINLAYLEAVLAGPRLRGRFAAQFGTSVQATSAGASTVGTLSAPDATRYIQEASLGYALTPRLWVDGGVFASSFGSESWVSRDNWTYTRSFIADYAPPYYETGLRATWQATPVLGAQLHLINGWQNISETNSDKAIGARVDITPRGSVALAYDVLVGNEQPDSTPSQLRVWQEAIVQVQPTTALQLRATFDYGRQRRATRGTATWTGWTAIARYRLTSLVALALRGEGYSDPEQVLVSTGQPFGLRVSAASLNVDVAPAPRLLWRAEVRAIAARDPVFIRSDGRRDETTRHDRLVVSSVALTF